MNESFSAPTIRPAGRFLSREECFELAKFVEQCAAGGGRARVMIESGWRGNLRWARNQIISSGDVRDNTIRIQRMIKGASAIASTNQVDRSAIEATVRRAERLLRLNPEALDASLYAPYQEPYPDPLLWFDTTYNLGADERAETMQRLVQPAKDAGMLAAGYIQVSAHGRATIEGGLAPIYTPYTQAQYSVTVRDPQESGSGWAGVDWGDWQRINAAELSAIALDKCLRSRNPVAIEPGRYTAILEPQATFELVSLMMDGQPMDRRGSESLDELPFWADEGLSKIGERIVDDRVTITTDPMDPDLAFPPVALGGAVYNPATWIDRGILTALAYNRDYGVKALRINRGLPFQGAFRMAGGTTTIEEMITTTKRGIYVTRFSDVNIGHLRSLTGVGMTRDGTWLIENGAISKPIKNFRIVESPLFALNNLIDMGVPQRVFSPGTPAIVPPLKVRDFSFASLVDAV